MPERHVLVDPERCFGSGDCELALPSAFRVDETGVAQVLPEARAVDVERLREVAVACPTSAIAVSDG